MTTQILNVAPAFQAHLSLFFHPHGSPASLRTRLESELLELVTSLRGQVDYCGTGGAPHFERWLVVSLPSQKAAEQLEAAATILSEVAARRLPPLVRGQSGVLLVCLAMTADVHSFVMQDPDRLQPELVCEQVTVLDFSTCLDGHSKPAANRGHLKTGHHDA